MFHTFFFYLIFYKGPWQPSLIRNIPKELRHCAKPTAVSPRLLTTFVNSSFANFALACILTKIQVGVLVVISTYAKLFIFIIDKILPKADVAFIAMALDCHMLLQIKAS